MAREQTILSVGTIRTPEILTLSGISPSDSLKFDVPTVCEFPDVGKNLFYHFSLLQIWKLRIPELGLALRSLYLTTPAFGRGMPCDLAGNEATPSNPLCRPPNGQKLFNDRPLSSMAPVPLCGERLSCRTPPSSKSFGDYHASYRSFSSFLCLDPILQPINHPRYGHCGCDKMERRTNYGRYRVALTVA